MKTKILSFLFVLSAMVLISNKAFAANDITPEVGQVETYTVVPVNGQTGGTYAWTVSGDSGTDYSITGGTLGTSTSNTITWLKPGTYNFSVVWTDGNNCLSEPLTWTVTVAAPVVQFATANQSGTTCSWLYNTTPDPDIDRTGNSSTVSTNDEIELAVTMTGGTPNITITYQIWDVTGTATQINSSNTYTQTVSALTGNIVVSIDRHFENETANEKNYEIRIISAKDQNNVDYTLGTNLIGTINIHAKPTMTFTGS